jgi:N-acetylmuramoyl-L-alanine amidase
VFSRQLLCRTPNIARAGMCLVVTAAAVTAGLAPVAYAAPVPPDVATKLAGKTVFLDPGHQGPDHTQNLARPVNNGRGGTKECQTTGMTALDGTPEHTINWRVASLVKQSLEALGARVVMSRQDDTGWGGCVDERAAAANRSGADIAISIHADSAPPQDRGFHMIVPQLPVPNAKVNQVQAGAGMAATKAVRDAYVKAGFPEATYAGAVNGLQTRSDIVGPALTEVPDVFIEMGNGANKDDAAQLVSNDGQIKHAIAITTGLVTYLLGGQPSSGSADSRAAAPLPGQPNAVPAANLAPGAAQDPPQSPAPTAAPTAPEQSAPSAYTPGTAPQYQAPGTAPQNQSVPGATPQPGTSITPGTQTQPGAANSTDSNSAMATLIISAIKLLSPLGKALGLGDLANSELINLAYTLVSTLIGAAGNAATAAAGAMTK